MNKRLEQWFCFSTAVVLFIAAAFIWLSTFTPTVMLDTPNDLLGLSNRRIFQLVAGIELALSAFLLLSQDRKLKLLLIAFVSGNFFIYHIGLAFAGEPNLFVCLATLTRWVPIPPHILNGMIYGVLGWLLSGSCVFLAGDWLVHRRHAPTRPTSSATTVPSLQNC